MTAALTTQRTEATTLLAELAELRARLAVIDGRPQMAGATSTGVVEGPAGGIRH